MRVRKPLWIRSGVSVFWVLAFGILRLSGKGRSIRFLESLPPVCPMKRWFGVSCAFCGMTHAFLHAAFFEFRESVHSNALSVVVVPGLVGGSLALAWGFRPAFSERSKRGAVIGSVVVLVTYMLIRNL